MTSTELLKMKAAEVKRRERNAKRQSEYRKRKGVSVTGRDHTIVAQALAYAIAIINSLPEERQEASNREDMIRMLESMCSPPMIHYLTAGARWHLFGEQPNWQKMPVG
jgi:hypothetical protein